MMMITPIIAGFVASFLIAFFNDSVNSTSGKNFFLSNVQNPPANIPKNSNANLLQQIDVTYYQQQQRQNANKTLKESEREQKTKTPSRRMKNGKKLDKTIKSVAEEEKPKKQKDKNNGRKRKEKKNKSKMGKMGKFMFTVFMVISMFVPQVPLNLVIKHNDHFLPIAPENLACREATNGTGYNCELSVNKMVVDDDCRDVSIWARMDNDTSTLQLLGEQVKKKKKLKQFRQNWIRDLSNCTKTDDHMNCAAELVIKPDQIGQLQRLPTAAISKTTKIPNSNLTEKHRRILDEEGFDTGVCTFPPSPSSQLVPDTLPTITTDTDFGFTTFVGGPGLLGGGECDVNNGRMKYMFVLADGVTIENAILDTPGMGIFCRGSCTLKNIFYKRLCYHAAGFEYDDLNQVNTYKVIGGGGIGSPDKYFTQSGRGKTEITGFCGDGKFGKLFCSCGSCPDQVERHVTVSNVKMRGPGLTIVSVNQIYGDTASLSGIHLYGQDSQDTMVDYICQIYSGKSKKNRHPEEVFTANQDGQGPCGYSTSQVALETAGVASSTPQQQVPTTGGTPGAAGQTPNTVPTAGGMPGATGQVYPPNMINPLTGLPDPNIIDPATGQPYPNIIDPATGQPYPKVIDPTTGLPYNPFRPYTNTPQRSTIFPNYFGSASGASSRLPRPLFTSSLWGSSTFYVCLLISLFVPQIPNTLMLHHNDQYVEIDSKYLSCDPITKKVLVEDDAEEEEEEEEEDEGEEGGYYCKFTVRLEQKEGNKCVSKALDFGEIGGARDKAKSGPIDERKDNTKKRITDQKDSAKKRITDQKDNAKNGASYQRLDSSKNGTDRLNENSKKRITDQKDSAKKRITDQKDNAKNGASYQRLDSAKNGTDQLNENAKKRITPQRKDKIKKRPTDHKKGTTDQRK
ncbi:hypothetical protein niasHS_013822 [Heterodera schachtii]|uniref:Probable pectate lyase F n=1 Tax=Heterodera schachtii TaxID=97005 RepID=A0ABD2IQP2_HETSC